MRAGEFETASQAESSHTLKTDVASDKSRSLEAGKQRRRRGDRSKAETAAIKDRVKRLFNKKAPNNEQVFIQPVSQPPILKYETKKMNVVSAAQDKDTSNVVDFANLLLAKHEAKMR